MANAIRALAMDAVEQAASGHPGMPMGMADVATVLFARFLKFDPAHPSWPDRDRFVLSAGHGSMLLYALLHLTGYADMPLEELKRFRKLGARTAGHPEFGHAAGIETTTGPLGQGLANAVGMALAERMLNAQFGNAVVNHRTYVIAGDGDLMEGISHEAASLAGHLRLSHLTVLFDDNGISIDGPTRLSVSDDTLARFAAYGWEVSAINGHDPAAIGAALRAANAAVRPTLIACRTTIGYGAPTKAGTEKTHGSPLGKEEMLGARHQLGWPHPPFELPKEVRALWRATAQRGAEEFAAWKERYAALAPSQKAEFERRIEGELPEAWLERLNAHKRRLIEKKPAEATRKSSEAALEVLTEIIPEMVGGSADLTGSNNTKTKQTLPVSAHDYHGRYIHYGVREHAMAAVMNGLSLHGGFIPYGGTFLVFSDYARPAIRLSALMGQRVIYVMTHDSIGLGEDGPTHQPVEQLAALRAIPGLYVFRPADAVETAECWALALFFRDAPSLLALTRQNIPTVRTQYREKNLCARGGYVLSDCSIPSEVTLIATGSEVHLALAAQEDLCRRGVPARVVSLPCWELFDQQPAAYRRGVLSDGLKVAVEAGVRLGWEKYIGADGIFIGMPSFGASGPYEDVYTHFGITPLHVVNAVLKRLDHDAARRY
ncbi:MAG: transketolase [Alphaproteobacteria bacterium]|nr:transketolase [Alphaproteobacteria bacterium]